MASASECEELLVAPALAGILFPGLKIRAELHSRAMIRLNFAGGLSIQTSLERGAEGMAAAGGFENPSGAERVADVVNLWRDYGRDAAAVQLIVGLTMTDSIRSTRERFHSVTSRVPDDG